MPFLIAFAVLFPVLLVGSLVLIDRATARSKSWNEG